MMQTLIILCALLVAVLWAYPMLVARFIKERVGDQNQWLDGHENLNK